MPDGSVRDASLGPDMFLALVDRPSYIHSADLPCHVGRLRARPAESEKPAPGR